MAFPNSFRFISAVSVHGTTGMYYKGGWRTRDIALLNYSAPIRGQGNRHGFWDHLKDLFEDEGLRSSTLVTLGATRGAAIRLKAVVSEVMVRELKRLRERFNNLTDVVRVNDMRLFMTGTTEVQEQNRNNGHFVTTATFIHDDYYLINLAEPEPGRRPRFLFNYDNFDSDDDSDTLQLDLKGYSHSISEPTPRGVHRLRITLDFSLEWQTENNLAFNLIQSPSKRIKIADDDFLDTMLKDNSGKDFIVVSGAGKEFPCHRVVLKGRSKMLEALVNSNMMEGKESRLTMVGSSDKGLEHLIRYLYGKEIPMAELTPGLALEFLQLGDMYQLNDLVISVCSILMRKDGDWLTYGETNVEDLLGLYNFAIKADTPSKMKLGSNLLEAMAWLLPAAFLASTSFGEMTKEDSNALLFKMLEIHIKHGQHNLD